MLIETWERLRGKVGWTSTVATVQSSILEDAGFGDVMSVCTIVWYDQRREPHSAEFEIVETSPLYQLCERDTLPIKFNPEKPDEFYVPSLLQSRRARTTRLTLFVLLYILAIAGIVVSWFGPHILTALSR